ncbi:MAG TPA: flagellar basal body L-ring protein FlgH, partial [Rhizomicrobium sp.]
WPALTTDRNAYRIGDVLQVVVYESAAASNTATNGSSRGSNFGGQVSAGTAFNQGGNLDLHSGSESTGTTGRSGGIVAQISVRVDDVTANGDLRVSGAEQLNINGEKTNIRVRGLVRRADISAANTVLSSRLAEAQIDYDGSGFVSRSAAPGLLARVFNWLGVP